MSKTYFEERQFLVSDRCQEVEKGTNEISLCTEKSEYMGPHNAYKRAPPTLVACNEA